MVQSAAWPKLGYYRSMNVALVTGIVGSGIGVAVGLASGDFFLAILFAFLLVGNVNGRRQLKAAGPYAFEDEGIDYSASLFPHETPHKHRKLSKRRIRRAQKREAAERADQDRVDAILAKVSAHGMSSLTYMERRALHKATERQRKRDEMLREEMTKKGF
jgi:hypothetical protein